MRPGPGLVVMALAFISGARRGSTSTSQQKLSSLTSSYSSFSSPSSSSFSSSSKTSLLSSPTSEYHFYQKEQYLPPEKRRQTHSYRYPPDSLPPSPSLQSPSLSYFPSTPDLSSSNSFIHTQKSSAPSNVPQHPLSSSLSSEYRNLFTITDYDRNDEIEQKYHFDNLNLNKISYVNLEDYGENTEFTDRGGGSGSEDGNTYDDRGSSFFSSGIHSHSHIFESTSCLSRVNPWLSACDLAQPSSAPDLQGQCTAGSLPVAWVDEGPGPPTCPKSCEQLKLENNLNSNSNPNDNKLNNNDNNNLINFKNNNNFNPVHNIMSKVRREISAPTAAASVSAKSTTMLPGDAAATKDVSSSQLTAIKPPGVVERTTTTISTASINANKMVADKTVEKRSKNLQHQDTMQSDTQSPSTQDHHYNYNNLDNYNYIVKNNLNNRKNVNTNTNIKIDNSNQYNQNQQQQQCLDYLGDNDDSSPTQLCKNSRSDLDKKLRHLRLKHCCERTVLSALHTIALNVTLGGGQQCIRILTDIMDLDSLATRITCELAEILFRYDCRQIYSLKHQCKDCKEAYRRWVCSTLIPYFAEQSSTSRSENFKDSAAIKTTTTTTTTTTETAVKTSNSKNNLPNKNQPNYPDKYNINDNNENFERDKFSADSLSLYDDEIDDYSDDYVEKTKFPSSPSLSIRSLTATVIGHQHQQEYQRNEPHSHFLNKRSTNSKKCESTSHRKSNIDERIASDTRERDFISTANNQNPCVEDSVIPRLLTRTKRKIEFRKRRRIRPCLSVCQTVEQQCPYLLPGDRAPAYPTQYAGEPTFLCLDEHIPETGEQLRKSNHGPPECCYRYCDQPVNDICIYCDDFDDGSGKNLNKTAAIKNLRDTNSTAEDRLASTPQAEESSELSQNSTTNATTITSIEEIEQLPYYAYSGLVYYYDDITDLPKDPVVECQPVASVTSRCTFPYFASVATKLDAKKLISQRYMLIWSSIICLLVNNYILVIVHNMSDSNYRFYYYCCYNLYDWWRRLTVFVMSMLGL